MIRFLFIMSFIYPLTCAWGKNIDTNIVSQSYTQREEVCDASESYYTVDAQLTMILLHIFCSLSDIDNKEVTDMRTKTIISLMQIQQIKTKADVHRVNPPAAWSRILLLSPKTGSPDASTLVVKKNIKKIEKDYGKKFASAFRAYCKKLETLHTGDSPSPDTLSWKDALNTISLVVRMYHDLPAYCKDIQDTEEVEYLQVVLERLATRIYILQQEGIISISSEQQMNIYYAMKGYTVEKLKRLIRQTVVENGLPHAVSAFNEQNAAEQWHQLLKALYKNY